MSNELALPDDQGIVVVDGEQSLATLIQQHSIVSRETVEVIRLIAPIYHNSRLYNTTHPDQIAVAMIKAAGFGIQPANFDQFFDIIDGRAGLKPIGTLAFIHRSGIIRVEIDDSRDDQCTVVMVRLDTGFTHIVTYTEADARKSNLIKDDKPNSAWNRFRKDMYRNRALGRCARIVAPDIIGNMPLTTELEELRSQTR